MPRNSSGSYTLPAGNPVTSGTTISTTWANSTLSDLGTEISDSASRSGKGNFTAPVRVPDGTAAAPAFAFGGEINSGFYRAGANDVRLTVGGVDALKLTSGGIVGPLLLANGSTEIQVTLTNGFLLLRGNQPAGATPPDVVADSSVARTAGNLFGVRNFGANKLFVDYQGLLQLVTPATAIQPASIWTAITPNTGWTAGSGLGYWKDASGLVRLRGFVTVGAGAANPMFTLPAGFRPSSARYFAVVDPNSSVGAVSSFVQPDGQVWMNNGITTGHLLYLDSIAFLAEA